MVKRAVLVGCNYAGTKAALNGCINDVSAQYGILTKMFGFQPDDITVLVDSRPPLPTGKNVKDALTKMVKSAQAGDVLFFHFSGHGVQVPSEDPKCVEKDGKDECIVPCDFNLIVDDDLKAIVKNVPPGARFTMVSDCCHSGTMLDGENVEIEGPKEGKQPGLMSLLISTAIGQGRDFSLETDDMVVTNRSLPLDILEEVLTSKTGHRVSRGGNIHASLAEVFGRDASRSSRRVMRILDRVESKLGEAFGGLFYGGRKSSTSNRTQQKRGFFGSALGFIQDAFSGDGDCASAPTSGAAAGSGGGNPSYDMYYGNDAAMAVLAEVDSDPDDDDDDVQAEEQKEKEKKASAKPKVDVEVPVLITGCQSHETSADACPSGDKSKAFGALTNAISTVLAAYPNGISNRDLVVNVREYLKSQRFPQNPCLECASPNAAVPFLC